MSVLLFNGVVFGNFASAESLEKKKSTDNAKDLKQDARKKALEKIQQDLKAKKENSKKQLALAALKLRK